MKSDAAFLRYDLQIVASWIPVHARVLGLGCGDGALLHHLKTRKGANCTGIEIDERHVAHCIEKGLSVLQGNINDEVLDYPDDAFDFVVLALTLQQIYAPDQLIRNILRIGRHCVVSFPNFSHWANRLQLLIKGQAPVSLQLPYEWYDTPNIRVITLKDFRRFAREVGFTIEREVAIRTHQQDRSGQVVRILPNLRATYGLYLIGNNKPK